MKKREKHGGRKAGTPNKRSQEALQIFGELEFCPLKKVIERLKKPGISDELYTSTCVKLLEFKFPKRKAIEHSIGLEGKDEEELIRETKEFIAQYEASKTHGDDHDN